MDIFQLLIQSIRSNIVNWYMLPNKVPTCYPTNSITCYPTNSITCHPTNLTIFYPTNFTTWYLTWSTTDLVRDQDHESRWTLLPNKTIYLPGSIQWAKIIASANDRDNTKIHLPSLIKVLLSRYDHFGQIARSNPYKWILPSVCLSFYSSFCHS